MKLLKTIQRIPGGLMLIPMLLAMIIYSFFPAAAQLGNPARAIFSSNGTMTIVGVMLVFAGIQTDARSMALCMKKSGLLILLKLVISIAVGLVVMHFFGKEGMFGISTLALVACLASTNSGLYIALMESYGDAGDKAGFALLNIVGLPFVPVCILGWAAGSGVDWAAILATCVPYAAGVALGALDPSIRDFTRGGNSIMLPFLGFCLGSAIDLKLAATSVGSGLLLFLLFLVCNYIPLLLLEKGLLRQTGYVSIAVSTVAGLSMTVPGLMLEADPTYAPYVQQAVAQLAVVVILSSVSTPFVIRRFLPKRSPQEQADTAAGAVTHDAV